MRFIFAPRYKRQFRKLTDALQKKAMERLALFMQDEFHPLLGNHLLRREWEGCRSINVTGDYRMVFKKISEHVTSLEAIGTHHELYGS